MSTDKRPIAIFDSGVGGLSILNEIRLLLPNEDLIYLADQGHVPYGPRPYSEIRRFTEGITRYFLTQNVKVIVIACNTACAAALGHIRDLHSDFTFVGMEPAVKPAAERTKTGVIGVISTKATAQGKLFASAIERHADGIEVIKQVCPDFVLQVEAGQFDTPEVRQSAESYLRPLVDANIDQLVLACTHFPFLVPVMREIIGGEIEIIDPGPSVARQVARVIIGNESERSGDVRYLTSGDVARFYQVAELLIDEKIRESQVEGIRWGQDDSTLTPV